MTSRLNDNHPRTAWTWRSARHRYIDLRRGRNDDPGNLNVHFGDRRYLDGRNHNPPRTDRTGTNEPVRILLRSYYNGSGGVIMNEGQRNSAVILFVNRAGK